MVLWHLPPYTPQPVERILETVDAGKMVLWHLPPYMPQHNPIEIVWREIKRQ